MVGIFTIFSLINVHESLNNDVDRQGALLLGAVLIRHHLLLSWLPPSLGFGLGNLRFPLLFPPDRGLSLYSRALGWRNASSLVRGPSKVQFAGPEIG